MASVSASRLLQGLMLLFTVHGSLSAVPIWQPPNMNDKFKNMRTDWEQKKCIFPDRQTFSFDPFEQEADFVLRPCSGLPPTPANTTFSELLCSSFFGISLYLCDEQENIHIDNNALARLTDDEKWNVCETAKKFAPFTFMTQDSKVCQSQCVNDTYLAPICNQLVAAAYIFENARKSTEVKPEVADPSGAPDAADSGQDKSTLPNPKAESENKLPINSSKASSGNETLKETNENKEADPTEENGKTPGEASLASTDKPKQVSQSDAGDLSERKPDTDTGTEASRQDEDSRLDPKAAEEFKNMTAYWVQNQCLFPAPKTFETNILDPNSAFLLRPCSGLDRLDPANAQFTQSLCTLLFQVSKLLCKEDVITNQGNDIVSDALDQLINNKTWDICGVTKKLNVNVPEAFQFIIQDGTICQRWCMEDKVIAPVCRQLIAVMTKYVSAVNKDQSKPGVDSPTDQPKPGVDSPTDQPKPGVDSPTDQPKPDVDSPADQPKPDSDSPADQHKPGGDSDTKKSKTDSVIKISQPTTSSTTTTPSKVEIDQTDLKDKDSADKEPKNPEDVPVPISDQGSSSESSTTITAVDDQQAAGNNAGGQQPLPAQNQEADNGVQQSVKGMTFIEDTPPSGHFMAYFITAVVICVAGYVIYHNKQKIFAFVLEGRRDTQRRRASSGSSGGSTAKYSKLQPSVEEVMPSLEKSTTSKNYIY